MVPLEVLVRSHILLRHPHEEILALVYDLRGRPSLCQTPSIWRIGPSPHSDHDTCLVGSNLQLIEQVTHHNGIIRLLKDLEQFKEIGSCQKFLGGRSVSI